MRKYLMIAYAPHNIAHNIIKSDAKWNQLSTFGGDEARDLCTGPECVCASACALIWFGAVERLGLVGLHRPRIDDPMFKAFGPTDAAKAYRGVLDDIARYMAEMEVPRPMLDAMVATGSSEIRWIYSDDENLERPPSFAEWEDAACGPFTKQENESIINLGVKSHMSPLTAEEALLLKLLEEKQTKKIHCQGELRTSRREQLPPP